MMSKAAVAAFNRFFEKLNGRRGRIVVDMLLLKQEETAFHVDRIRLRPQLYEWIVAVGKYTLLVGVHKPRLRGDRAGLGGGLRRDLPAAKLIRIWIEATTPTPTDPR